MKTAFSESARCQVRNEILAAGGNEVFFLGRTDSQLLVTDVVVLARGARDAVPAILSTCDYGDVVIHNHPSGNLQPSTADMEIAGHLGSLGVAFYIVDNPVENVYKVVDAFVPRTLHEIVPQKIAAILDKEGAVSRFMPDFEERPEQLRMAFLVAEAFNRNRLALVEAGTGTGKSLAYLVPAILWSDSNRERVVVSTRTINLQEQLIRKDIPFLQRALDRDVRAVLVKGRNQYLCLRRAELALREPGLFDEEKGRELDVIWAWAGETADGSLGELPFIPSEQIWEEVCCEYDQCLRVRCPQFKRCFFHKARREAAQADILVANHALLMTDLAIRTHSGKFSSSAILPPFNRLIIDEAHHLEDVATSFFSTQATRFGYARVLNRLRHPRKRDKGLLPRLLVRLGNVIPASENELYSRLYERIQGLLGDREALLSQAIEELEGMARSVAGLSEWSLEAGEEHKQRITDEFRASPVWETITEKAALLAGQTSAYGKALKALLTECGGLEEGVYEDLNSFWVDLAAVVGRLERLASELQAFLARDEKTCAWIELGMGRVGRGQGLICRLCTAPLEVADILRESFFDRHQTVVLTSATLAIGCTFDYLKERLGLTLVEAGRLLELQLFSPFDFQRKALVAIPEDIPEPRNPAYAEALSRVCERAVLAADGRSFILFTAYSLLAKIHAEIAPVLSVRGYRCLRQGEASRHRLLQMFVDDPTSVLFATDSFWEGVDVPGRSLEQIIITRLPFRVPTDPVVQARTEAIEKSGGDSFLGYTIPQAVIRFKQGFGRLIRSRGDRGVVLILDSRVVNKGYGKIFLQSLPNPRLVTGTVEDVFAEIQRFFTNTAPVSDSDAGSAAPEPARP